MNSEIESLHQKAVTLCATFTRTENDLIEILQLIDSKRVYAVKGFGSLFEYAVSLGLSESNAYTYCSIARKSKAIPELKVEIEQGRLSVSKAKRILPVITPENQAEWIERAETLPKAELEKAVVRENPQLQKRETIRRLQPERLSVSFSVSDELMKKMKRVQDVLSSERRRAMNLEDSLEELVEAFLERRDPVRRAERKLERNTQSSADQKTDAAGGIEKMGGDEAAGGETGTFLGVPASPHPQPMKHLGPSTNVIKRRLIPAKIKHELVMNSSGQCTFVSSQGVRCHNQRWLEIHHQTPVAKNGANTIENLILYCSTHHRLVHAESVSRR
jgi:hypothetical protein